MLIWNRGEISFAELNMYVAILEEIEVGSMKKIPCRLNGAEEAVSKMDLFHVADDVMESGEDYQIVISGWWVHIPELDIKLHEGVFCNYDVEEKAYLPDFSITVIREVGAEGTEGEWFYYEQDGFVITLANYLHGSMDISSIEQLSCCICIPDDLDGESEQK